MLPKSASGTLFIEKIELGEWPVLGRDLTLDLDENCTVLVGKNAAGKSLILEGLYWGTKTALGIPPRPRGSRRFAVTLKYQGGARLRYEFTRALQRAPNDANPDERPRAFHAERCEWLGEDSQVVWEHREGEGSLQGMKLVVGDSSLVALANLRSPVIEAELLAEIFSLTRLVTAGVPRDRAHRLAYIARRDRPQPNTDRRIGRLASIISHWYEDSRERFDELVGLAQKVGVLRSVAVQALTSGDASAKDELIDVRVDGANIGLLSDGTLRVIETLVAILSTPLLLLEEPETGIHPGLLSRLLSILDSYSADRQLLISTHSPVVVNWAKPQQIRIVERSSGVTTARALDREQIAAACRHLDESCLGEFVYGGGADQS